MDFQQFRKQFNEDNYTRYRVQMRLADLAGGVPADPKMIDGWIAAGNKAATDEQRKALAEATKEELPEIAEEKEARAWCRFKRDETGPYLEGRCLKAALKEAANIVKPLVKVKGRNGEDKPAAALKSKFAECVFVDETKVYLCDADGTPITGDLKTEERPVHVMTRQGPRTSLKRVDVVYDVLIDFTVVLAKTGAVTERALFSALAYLERGGIGSDRSQGRGVSTDIKVEKL